MLLLLYFQAPAARECRNHGVAVAVGRRLTAKNAVFDRYLALGGAPDFSVMPGLCTSSVRLVLIVQFAVDAILRRYTSHVSAAPPRIRVDTLRAWSEALPQLRDAFALPHMSRHMRAVSRHISLKVKVVPWCIAMYPSMDREYRERCCVLRPNIHV